MARRFTLAEAQSLIQEIDRLIREAVENKAVYEESQMAIQQIAQRVMMMGGIVVDRSRILEQRATGDRAAEELKQAIERIQEQGCLVKDLDLGLVDFPTLYRGREVYLCWKLGEGKIEFWHGVDEGFAGRKPIDDEFLRDHRGDAPQ